MALKIERKQVDFDACFQEDMDQYYDIANSFLNLSSEDHGTAFEISKKAWVLADRWASIAANASKLAALKAVNKTDLKDYCYRKYRQMQYIHEFCRVLWNKGEQASREKRVGV
jgi:hypothetical protein